MALFKLWNPKIFGFAYQFTQNKEAAQEIAQETWVGVIKNLKGLKKESLFPIWVYRITQKKAADWLRQKYRHDEVEQEETFVEIAEDDSSEKKDEAEIVHGIREVIARLPANHRVILTLFYLESYDLDEISVILEIPKGTVKSRLHFAREKFKRIVESNKKLQDEIF